MKIKVLFLIAFIFIAITSCTKDTIEPIVTPPNTSSTFSGNVFPIFAAHSCTGCHATGGAGGLNLSGTPSSVRTNLITLGSVVANSSATSKLYTNFNGTSHKGISMTTTELSNIKGWIDSGAKDN
jgi:hypothetical protein